MRQFNEAKESWGQFLAYPLLADLKAAVRSDGASSAFSGARSLCWKAFLLFENSDRSEWLRRLSDSRSAYASVRTHLLRALENPEEVASGFDPLSEGVESPWAALRQDETLRAEILQDVDRCMPDSVYFRQPETQKMLLDILFVFCKLNPDVSYRQGMHELVAPILWVVEREAISGKPSGMTSSDDEMLYRICDADFIEHDTFTLFGIVMQGAKSFYEQAAHSGSSQLAPDSSKPAAKLENPILTRIHRIFDEYLPHVDPKLAQHLREIDLIPQVFLMKWIRLLFGREFGFDEVLAMWDVIFAEDPTLEIVDFICLIMIVRLHWDLVDADYNTALTTLLRYPAPTGPVTPQTLVEDALFLRDHLHQAGASRIIEKHSGKPMTTVDATDESSLPAPAQSVLGSRLESVGLAPTSPGKPSGNLDRILQDAAKGMFKRGEQWGINKAVRDAIVEVRKGVREIQNTPTPQRPRSSHNRTSSRQSGLGDSDAAARLAALERRNTALAKMLKNATDDLWKFHEGAVAPKDSEKNKNNNIEALSIAIAKVQFTQVYLEDSTVPLPVEEEDEGGSKAVEGPQKLAITVPETNTDADKDGETSKRSSSESSIIPQPPSKSRPKKSPSISNPKPDTPTDFQTPRPSLTQSSFSWMLGQDQGTSSFVQANPLPPSDARRHSRGFLFGEDKSSSPSGNTANSSNKNKGTNRLRKKRPESVSKPGEVLFEQESEVWDLGQLEEDNLIAKKERERKEKETEQEKDKTKEGAGAAGA